MVNVELFNRNTKDYTQLKCLIDTGAFCNYLNWSLVMDMDLLTRTHPSPYDAIGADGKKLARITLQALTVVKFGNHVNKQIFDVMNIGSLQCVLGREWLHTHDPIIRASNNYYPIFNRPVCKHHTQAWIRIWLPANSSIQQTARNRRGRKSIR